MSECFEFLLEGAAFIDTVGGRRGRVLFKFTET